MAKSKRSINSIIHNQLIGDISKEDSARLQSWLNTSAKNREDYEHLLVESDLVDRCRLYGEVDEDQAWAKFQKKHLQVRRFHWTGISRYAAVLMLPFIGLAVWFWILSESDSHPTISHENRVAMIRSERMGKQKATLLLTTGRKVDLQPIVSSPTQTPITQPAPTPVQKEPSQAEPAKDKNQLITYPDSEFWMTFEDGTRVHLNYNTTLKYPPHFASNNRIVYLEGEAYFQIAKDSKRPFLVVTGDGIVRQCGTSFNVNTRTSEGTSVVLVEGAISVLPNQGEEHEIKPGEMALLQASTKDVRIRKVDVEPYIAWHNGRFVFDNCTLESLMNVISHWYDKDIIFDTEDIKKMRFTGDIDRYGSIAPILKAIQRVTHLDIEIEDRAIVIRK